MFGFTSHSEPRLLSSDTPGAPYKLEPSDIAKDSLTLSWYEPDEDGGSPITGYWVERYEPDHDKWIRCNKLPIKDTNYRFLRHVLPEMSASLCTMQMSLLLHDVFSSAESKDFQPGKSTSSGSWLRIWLEPESRARRQTRSL